MYIHSQNKNTIVISKNLTNIYIKYSKVIIGAGKKYNNETGQMNLVKVNKIKSNRNYYYLYCTTVSGEDVKLGRYSSFERCKEILEEILDFYQDISVPNSVYYMPEE